MKKYFLVLMVACCMALPIVMSSCSSYGLTGQAAPLAYTDIKPDQIKANFDFNLKEKRVGEASATYLLGLIRVTGSNKYSDIRGINIQNGSAVSAVFGGSKTEKVKSAAVYNAIKDSGADIIVNPQFETETHSLLFGLVKTYKVKVKTYDAKIKEIYQEKVETKGYEVILKKD